MSGDNLRDNLHSEMTASNRPWSSEEIARIFLKLVSDARGADRLVGAILGSDPRFRRDPSGWTASTPPSRSLRDFPILIVDAPAPRTGAPDLCLFVRPHEPRGRPATEIIFIKLDGTGLERIATWLEERICVSYTAARARQQLHRFERSHGLPAASERLLDLDALHRRLGLDLPPALHGRGEEVASVEERFHAIHEALDRILDSKGTCTIEELEENPEEAAGSVAVDFSRFRFGSGLLDLLPSRPGVYKFLGEGGSLLYVGKSRDLHRRVSGYFRPLAPDHGRRSQLLSELRDLSWETTPCELEALILEAETIRGERPSFNQQIALHPSGETVAPVERDLAFVACEGDPLEVSVFLLSQGRAWARARIPRAPVEEALQRSRSVAEAWLSGHPEPSPCLVPIDESEGLLVLRYLRLYRDRLDQVRAGEVAGVEAAAHAISQLATRDRPAWDPWVVRSPGSREMAASHFPDPVVGL